MIAPESTSRLADLCEVFHKVAFKKTRTPAGIECGRAGRVHCIDRKPTVNELVISRAAAWSRSARISEAQLSGEGDAGPSGFRRSAAAGRRRAAGSSSSPRERSSTSEGRRCVRLAPPLGNRARGGGGGGTEDLLAESREVDAPERPPMPGNPPAPVSASPARASPPRASCRLLVAKSRIRMVRFLGLSSEK
jgi:hypothetical protein